MSLIRHIDRIERAYMRYLSLYEQSKRIKPDLTATLKLGVPGCFIPHPQLERIALNVINNSDDLLLLTCARIVLFAIEFGVECNWDYMHHLYEFDKLENYTYPKR
jgi:hypothetical protein